MSQKKLPQPSPDTEKIPASNRRKKRKIPIFLKLIFLVVLTAVVFSPLLKNTYLWPAYDIPERSVYANVEHWTEFWSLENIRKVDPVSQSSYLLEANIPGDPAQVHRAINIALHITIAVLLYVLLRKMKLPYAFVASLLFALHPATIQILFWPGYRHEILGCLLILTTLYLVFKSINIWRYLLLLLTVILSVAVNANALFIPAIMALLIFQKNYPLRPQHFNYLLPIVCVTLLFGFWFIDLNNQQTELPTIGSWSYQAGQSLQFYLSQTFYPTDAALFTPLAINSNYSINAGINLFPFLLFPPFLILGLVNYKSGWGRGLLAMLIIFLLLTIPAISNPGAFIDGSVALETHRYYFALMVILTFTASCLKFLFKKLKFENKTFLGFAICLLILTEAVASFSYASKLSDTTETWRNLHELWPESWQAQTIYLEHAITDEARFTKKDGLILLLQSLLDKNPELTNIRILMARTMRDSGQTNNALREFKRIVREGTNDITFLEEAVRLLENNNLNYEAEKVRLQIEAVQMPKLQTEE